MTSVVLLTAVLSVGAIGVEASWVVTEDHSYSSWCGEQPGYPHLGSTLFSQAYLLDLEPWPEGPAYLRVGDHVRTRLGASLLDGDYYVGGTVNMIGPGSLMLDGSTDFADNPHVDSCNYVIERTSFIQLLPGDATRDGVFNSSDLVAVFRAGQYEDGTSRNSTWDTGDWNADLDFTSGDLVVALQTGAYSAAASPVPEPSGVLLIVSGIVTILRHRISSRLSN